MQALLKQRVVVLAGYGEFSRRVASGVAALPQVECVLGLAPDERAPAFAERIGVPFVIVDPRDPSALQRLLEGAFIVVNVCGPFVSRDDLGVAAQCAALGVHYVDPADSREYLAEFLRLARAAEEHSALLVSGAGAAPAVTSALGDLLAKEFDHVNEIHSFLTPGMGDERESATIRAVLEPIPQPSLPKHKTPAPRRTESPETVLFPPPIGPRRGYRCDLPDLDLFARRFGARTVTARAGFASGWLNLAATVLANLYRRGWVQRSSTMPALLVRSVASLTRAHADAAAIRVAMRGQVKGKDTEHVIYLVARDGTGPAISAAPMLALVRKWVRDGVRQSGAMACVGLLDFDDLKPELMNHRIVLVRE